MIAQKNVTHLFVSSSTALATTAVPTIARQIGIRRIGELLCDATALVAGDQFQILYLNANGKVITSPMFNWDGVAQKSKKAVAAAASQVSAIGYNGTDGTITATNYGKYLVNIGLKDSLKQVGNKKLYKFGDYTAGATAKSYDVAIGLAGSLVQNLTNAKLAYTQVIPTAVCSQPYTAGNKSANNVTVVQGSKWVSEASALSYTGGTYVVGDYIRIGNKGATTVVDTAGSVYRIVEISSLNMRLDRPVTEVSGTYTAASGATEGIPKATAEGGSINWGILLTGNDANAPFEVGKFGNNLITFSVGVSTDFVDTPVRVVTTPSIGDGTFKAVAQLDWELQANRKEAYRIAEFPVTFVPNALSTDTYTYTYNIRFKEASTDSVAGDIDSYFTVMIVSQTTADANLATVFTL